MGFTLASIDPSMCAIIFAPKTFKDEWRTEVDPFAERIGDPDNLIESCSDGKVYTHLDLVAFSGENTYLAFVAILKLAP
jgi:hypothetical protein